MTSPADVSVFQISDRGLRSSKEELDASRIKENLVPEVEDEVGLHIHDVEIGRFNWQKELHKRERNAQSKNGWYVFQEPEDGRHLEWSPNSPLPTDSMKDVLKGEWNPLHSIQYFTRRARIQRDVRNVRGIYKPPDNILINYDLLDNLSEITGKSVEAYLDSTALEELGHLALNQNLEIDRSQGYADLSRKREEALVDEFTEEIFQELHGCSRRDLEKYSFSEYLRAMPYHEEALARLDEFVSNYGTELPNELNPREAYQEQHVPEEVYSEVVDSQNAEKWINTGET